MLTAASLTRDTMATGYGHIRIHNYKKNGEMFAGTVTVFPVYDTVTPTGVDSDVPILTHFAAVLEDVVDLPQTEQQRRGKDLDGASTCTSHMTDDSASTQLSSTTSPSLSHSSSLSVATTSSSISTLSESSTSSGSGAVGSEDWDPRKKCKLFVGESNLTPKVTTIHTPLKYLDLSPSHHQ